MLSVRIVTSEHYQAAPLEGLDVCYNEARGTEITRVPVIRLYGATPSGQKTCMHIHGVFPYLYVPYDGSLPLERYLRQFTTSLDKALNVALGRASSATQHVYKVSLVTGIPFYGYHEEETTFLKIYLYNPLMVKKVADLLLGGAVMNKVYQPFEAHIPYLLQMFIDYNLYGMNMLNAAAVKFRRPKEDGNGNVYGLGPPARGNHGDSISPDDSVTGLDDSLFTNSPSMVVWDQENIPEDLWLDESVQRQSTCALEVDVVAADVLNRLDVGGNLGTNPGLSALWDDERQRRRDTGGATDIAPPDSPERVGRWSPAEEALQEQLCDILNQLKPFLSDESSSDDESGDVTPTRSVEQSQLFPATPASDVTRTRSVEQSQLFPATPASDVDVHLSQAIVSEVSSQSTVIFSDDDDEQDEPIISEQSILRVVSASQSFRADSEGEPDLSQLLGNTQDNNLAQLLAALTETSDDSPAASQLTTRIISLEEQDSILSQRSEGHVSDAPGSPGAEEDGETETLEMSQRVWEGDQDQQRNEFADYDLAGMDQSWDSSQWQEVTRTEADGNKVSGDSESSDDDCFPQLDGPTDTKTVVTRARRLGMHGPAVEKSTLKSPPKAGRSTILPLGSFHIKAQSYDEPSPPKPARKPCYSIGGENTSAPANGHQLPAKRASPRKSGGKLNMTLDLRSSMSSFTRQDTPKKETREEPTPSRTPSGRHAPAYKQMSGRPAPAYKQVSGRPAPAYKQMSPTKASLAQSRQVTPHSRAVAPQSRPVQTKPVVAQTAPTMTRTTPIVTRTKLTSQAATIRPVMKSTVVDLRTMKVSKVSQTVNLSGAQLFQTSDSPEPQAQTTGPPARPTGPQAQTPKPQAQPQTTRPQAQTSKPASQFTQVKKNPLGGMTFTEQPKKTPLTPSTDQQKPAPGKRGKDSNVIIRPGKVMKRLSGGQAAASPNVRSLDMRSMQAAVPVRPKALTKAKAKDWAAAITGGDQAIIAAKYARLKSPVSPVLPQPPSTALPADQEASTDTVIAVDPAMIVVETSAEQIEIPVVQSEVDQAEVICEIVVESMEPEPILEAPAAAAAAAVDRSHTSETETAPGQESPKRGNIFAMLKQNLSSAKTSPQIEITSDEESSKSKSLDQSGAAKIVKGLLGFKKTLFKGAELKQIQDKLNSTPGSKRTPVVLDEDTEEPSKNRQDPPRTTDTLESRQDPPRTTDTLEVPSLDAKEALKIRRRKRRRRHSSRSSHAGSSKGQPTGSERETSDLEDDDPEDYIVKRRGSSDSSDDSGLELTVHMGAHQKTYEKPSFRVGSVSDQYSSSDKKDLDKIFSRTTGYKSAEKDRKDEEDAVARVGPKKTQGPSNEKTQEPSDGKTQEQTIEETQEPSDGKAQEPSNQKTQEQSAVELCVDKKDEITGPVRKSRLSLKRKYRSAKRVAESLKFVGLKDKPQKVPQKRPVDLNRILLSRTSPMKYYKSRNMSARASDSDSDTPELTSTVRVPKHDAEEHDLDIVGQEGLVLYKMQEEDIQELKGQVKKEMEHKRTEHIMPLALGKSRDEIESEYAEVKQRVLEEMAKEPPMPEYIDSDLETFNSEEEFMSSDYATKPDSSKKRKSKRRKRVKKSKDKDKKSSIASPDKPAEPPVASLKPAELPIASPDKPGELSSDSEMPTLLPETEKQELSDREIHEKEPELDKPYSDISDAEMGPSKRELPGEPEDREKTRETPAEEEDNDSESNDDLNISVEVSEAGTVYTAEIKQVPRESKKVTRSSKQARDEIMIVDLDEAQASEPKSEASSVDKRISPDKEQEGSMEVDEGEDVDQQSQGSEGRSQDVMSRSSVDLSTGKGDVTQVDFSLLEMDTDTEVAIGALQGGGEETPRQLHTPPMVLESQEGDQGEDSVAAEDQTERSSEKCDSGPRRGAFRSGEGHPSRDSSCEVEDQVSEDSFSGSADQQRQGRSESPSKQNRKRKQYEQSDHYRFRDKRLNVDYTKDAFNRMLAEGLGTKPGSRSASEGLGTKQASRSSSTNSSPTHKPRSLQKKPTHDQEQNIAGSGDDDKDTPQSSKRRKQSPEKLTRISPQKVIRESPQKVIRESPQKVIRESPQKTRESPQKNITDSPQKELLDTLKPVKVVLHRVDMSEASHTKLTEKMQRDDSVGDDCQPGPSGYGVMTDVVTEDQADPLWEAQKLRLADVSESSRPQTAKRQKGPPQQPPATPAEAKPEQTKPASKKSTTKKKVKDPFLKTSRRAKKKPDPRKFLDKLSLLHQYTLDSLSGEGPGSVHSEEGSSSSQLATSVDSDTASPQTQTPTHEEAAPSYSKAGCDDHDASYDDVMYKLALLSPAEAQKLDASPPRPASPSHLPPDSATNPEGDTARHESSGGAMLRDAEDSSQTGTGKSDGCSTVTQDGKTVKASQPYAVRTEVVRFSSGSVSPSSAADDKQASDSEGPPPLLPLETSAETGLPEKMTESEKNEGKPSTGLDLTTSSKIPPGESKGDPKSEGLAASFEETEKKSLGRFRLKRDYQSRSEVPVVEIPTAVDDGMPMEGKKSSEEEQTPDVRQYAMALDLQANPPKQDTAVVAPIQPVILQVPAFEKASPPESEVNQQMDTTDDMTAPREGRAGGDVMPVRDPGSMTVEEFMKEENVSILDLSMEKGGLRRIGVQGLGAQDSDSDEKSSETQTELTEKENATKPADESGPRSPSPSVENVAHLALQAPKSAGESRLPVESPESPPQTESPESPPPIESPASPPPLESPESPVEETRSPASPAGPSSPPHHPAPRSPSPIGSPDPHRSHAGGMEPAKIPLDVEDPDIQEEVEQARRAQLRKLVGHSHKRHHRKIRQKVTELQTTAINTTGDGSGSSSTEHQTSTSSTQSTPAQEGSGQPSQAPEQVPSAGDTPGGSGGGSEARNSPASSTGTVLTPSVAPPSREDIETDAVEHGLGDFQATAAFCSKPEDVPPKPRDVGGRVLAVSSSLVQDLPEWESQFSFHGLKYWQSSSLTQQLLEIGNSQETSEDLQNHAARNTQLRFALMGDDPVVITPCKPPPKPREVSTWLKAKAMYQRNLKKEQSKDSSNNKELSTKMSAKSGGAPTGPPTGPPNGPPTGPPTGPPPGEKNEGDSLYMDDTVDMSPEDVRDKPDQDPVSRVRPDQDPGSRATPDQDPGEPVLMIPESPEASQELVSPPQSSWKPAPIRGRKSVSFAEDILKTPSGSQSQTESGSRVPCSPGPDVSASRVPCSPGLNESDVLNISTSLLDDSDIVASTPVKASQYITRTLSEGSEDPACTPILGNSTPVRHSRYIKRTLSEGSEDPPCTPILKDCTLPKSQKKPPGVSKRISFLKDRVINASPDDALSPSNSSRDGDRPGMSQGDTPGMSQGDTPGTTQPSTPSRRLSASMDASLRRMLLNSQIKNQFRTPVRSVSDVSQIEGPTPKNSFGFKVASQNVQSAKALHEYQHLTIMSLELHIQTRGDLRPDPEFDAICCVFYSLHHDIPPERGARKVTGVILVDRHSAEQMQILRSYEASRSSRQTQSPVPSTSKCSTGRASPQPSTSTSTPGTSRDQSRTTGSPGTSGDQSRTTGSPVTSGGDEPTDQAPNRRLSPRHALQQTLLQKSGITSVDVTYVMSEDELINKVVEIVRWNDPDMVVGFEIEMLSWGYLIKRAAHLSLNLLPLLSRVPECAKESKVEADKDNYGADFVSDLQIQGRVVLNLWRIMRHQATLNIYTFENLMYHVLHRRVPCFSFRTLTEWFDNRTHLHRWRTVEYYITRIEGSLQLMEQVDLIGQTSEFARVFGIEFYHVLSRGTQYRVESMMLRFAKPMSYIPVSPSVQQRARMRAPECIPLTLEPESRFYSHPVIVLDFQSLYPSIMIAYNYCYSTCIGRIDALRTCNEGSFDFGCTSLNISPKTLKKLKDAVTICPNGVTFVKEHIKKGILPRMVGDILKTRLMVKKSMKEYKDDKTLQRLLHARQLSLKLIANVTFGYTSANFSGRMPCVEIGDSIVRKARETLERAIELVENTPRWGARVVYGDTDSMFIELEGRTKDQAFCIGQEIADAVTDDNPKPVKLKFEKVYLPCVLQTKKRYVGFMYETPDQKDPVFDAKGIETVRRDSCAAVSKMLEKSIKTLFTTRDITLVKQYVQRQCQKLMEGKVSVQDCIFAKEYRGMGGYKPTACVPALEIARTSLARDRRSEPRVGERVPYVIVYGTPGLPLIQLIRPPAALLHDPSLRINATYYITKQILPPLGRMLSLLGVDVFQWYKDLPRLIRAVPPSYYTSDTKKDTISQYFTTLNCPVCEETSTQGLCGDCRKDPQRVAIVTSSRIRDWERTYYQLRTVCDNCMGCPDPSLPCSSLDCPVLFRITKASRDQTQVPHLLSLQKRTLQF